MPLATDKYSNSGADAQFRNVIDSEFLRKLAEEAQASLARQRAEAKAQREEWNELFADLPDVANDDHTLDPVIADLDAALDAIMASAANDDEPAEEARKKSETARKKSKTKRGPSKVSDLTFVRNTRVPGIARPALKRGGKSKKVWRVIPSPNPSPDTDTDTTPRPSLWRDTTHVAKIASMTRVIYAKGDAKAWSLNLSPDIEKMAANENGATRLAGRIGYYLEKEFGKARTKMIMGDLAFVIGVTKDGRLHLHGIASANSNEEPGFSRALARAGGDWHAPAGDPGKQVDVRPLWNPDGWSRYMHEHLPQAERTIAGNPLYAPNTLRNRAKDLYTKQRNELWIDRRAES